MSLNPAGSIWARWDPHLHAPGTLLCDQFGGSWEKYLEKIENSNPQVSALGVTDYFCIQTYREVRKLKRQGRLPQVKLLFPNVELRLDVKTEKGPAINIHLLFSPDDPNHEEEVERILRNLKFEFREKQYSCTPTELVQLGREFDPSQSDNLGALRTGAMQFKVSLSDIRRLYRTEKWFRQNCLIAVAGSHGDGTAGIQADDSFTATRREIESFAHIIFASSVKQRDFWLGKLPSADCSFIERTYGCLKPCLHGSDAHREEKVVAPDLERFCWLKGDMNFETLKQAVIEPEERVWLGPMAPSGAAPSVCLKKIEVNDASWMSSPNIQLNSGLVAIIGPRGSGKTALVDIIAAVAGAPILGESSFLRRASSPNDLLGNASAKLTWGDGEIGTGRLSDALLQSEYFEENSDVCYLSQHFVERLCSSAGLAVELRNEMERVIFETTDPTDRLEADSFESMAKVYLEPIKNRRDEVQKSIKSIAEQVVKEDTLRERLPKIQKDIEALRGQILKSNNELKALLPKGKEEHSKKLSEFEMACTKTETKVEILKRRRKMLDDLSTEVFQILSYREPTRFVEMKKRFQDCLIKDTDWESFRMNFGSNVNEVIQKEKRSLDQIISQQIDGDPTSTMDLKKIPLTDWPLNKIRTARDQAKKEVGIDTERQKKYDLLQRTLGQQTASLRRAEAEINHASGATERRKLLINSRRSQYIEVIKIFIEEENVLKQLYSPLKKTLANSTGALAKLSFVVERRVDIVSWVKKGESLLDLRRDSKFRGHGSLEKEAIKHLWTPWKDGNAEQIATAMDAFRSSFQTDFVQAMPMDIQESERSFWSQSIADWLYDTQHIQIQYGIQYDGVAIEQLSPGTRGIVLLLLYLAVDQHDRRPLIVDQPEENLDPNSVFQELVPHFRSARKRRQVIVVTHNANLVVNTDADQVIIAESKHGGKNGLPFIKYKSGSIENIDIRNSVCQLLEGGERAFLERERRYRLRWGETNQ